MFFFRGGVPPPGSSVFVYWGSFRLAGMVELRGAFGVELRDAFGVELRGRAMVWLVGWYRLSLNS